MTKTRWMSIGIVQTAGEPQILQQEMQVGGYNADYGMMPERDNTHRLISLSEATGVEPLDDEMDVIE